MLKPAICYKTEIESKFAKDIYSDNYFWYTGYGSCTEPPTIKAQDDHFQWAIVDNNDEVVGYFAYRIDSSTDTVLNFGLYSFRKGNIYTGKDVFEKMNELVKEHRRVEWRMISDNPVRRAYDRFCLQHGGNIVMLHQVTKDIHGKWYDEYIYEIVKG